MSAPVDFYFDFSSPCGYVASERIDALVEKHGRTVVWHSIGLDANFQPQDRIRIPAAVMRRDCVQRDALRTAAFFGVPFELPSQQGLHTGLAARGFLWPSDRDPEQDRDWAHAVLRAYFGDDRNIATIEVLLDLAGAAGIDPVELAAAINDGASRQRMKAEIDRAEPRGVLASPLFIVEGERFRDTSRMAQLERWLESGPYRASRPANGARSVGGAACLCRPRPRQAGKKLGVNMRDIFWEAGDCDIVCVLKAEDEHGPAAFNLSIATQGNVRSHTLRACTAGEMDKVLARLAHA